MTHLHLIRLGALAHVGSFSSVDAVRYPRGSRVVLRTARGLELGEVLTPGIERFGDGTADGTILRGMTAEDELLEARLSKNRREAYEACAARIRELGSEATLMDVEQLFDGRTLVFYFLGEPPPELATVTDDLAAAYDAEAQIGRFAEVLTNGCGPNCGTDEAGDSACSFCETGCAVAEACGTRRA